MWICQGENFTISFTFCDIYIYIYIYIYLFIYYWIYIYIPSSRANKERSAGSRVWYLGPFTDFQLRLRSSTPSLQPKYQTTGVDYTALYDHSLLQPHSAQPTLLACQCRGPRIKSQICSGTGELNPGPFAPAAECVTTRPPRPVIYIYIYIHIYYIYYIYIHIYM